MTTTLTSPATASATTSFHSLTERYVNHYGSNSSERESLPGSRSSVEALRQERLRLLTRLKQIESDLEILVQQDRNLSGINPLQQQSLPQPSEQQQQQCAYGFTVYVYPIPATLNAIRISEEARRNGTLHVCRKCILEQFALEYIVYDFFTSFCGRVHRPDQADYFYLPLVRDAEFRYAMQEYGNRFRTPSPAEDALLDLMEKNDSAKWREVFGVTDHYWHRHQGADHIIVMPAPVTNLRHETGMRGFFHYMSHLHSPIFLHLEYSKQFVQEYPVCAKEKNIMLPYPTTDPDLFSGKLTVSFHEERSFLLYYAGGMHGECVEVRQALREILTNSSRISNIVPPVRSNQEERELGFLQAKFCPIPIGDSPSSKRMYDVLNFGCVPVVLSDDLVWALSDQTGGPLNHSLFSIQIPQSIVHYTAARSLRVYRDRKSAFGVLPSGKLVYDILAEAQDGGQNYEQGVLLNPLVQVLRRIPHEEWLTLQRHGREAGERYRYYAFNRSMVHIPTALHQFPNGGAIALLAEELQKRKSFGLVRLFQKCKEERIKQHSYVPRFSCDGKDTVDSLLLVKERSRGKSKSKPKPKPRPRPKER
eukprot:gene4619-5062_t